MEHQSHPSRLWRPNLPCGRSLLQLGPSHNGRIASRITYHLPIPGSAWPSRQLGNTAMGYFIHSQEKAKPCNFLLLTTLLTLLGTTSPCAFVFKWALNSLSPAALGKATSISPLVGGETMLQKTQWSVHLLIHSNIEWIYAMKKAQFLVLKSPAKWSRMDLEPVGKEKHTVTIQCVRASVNLVIRCCGAEERHLTEGGSFIEGFLKG